MSARLDPLLLEDAFIALTDGVVVTDPDGRVVSANPAAFRLLGEDQLAGRMFDDLLLISGAVAVQRTPGHSVRRAWFPREDRMGVLELVSTNVAERGWIHTVRDVTAQAEMLRLKEDFLLQVLKEHGPAHLSAEPPDLADAHRAHHLDELGMP